MAEGIQDEVGNIFAGGIGVVIGMILSYELIMAVMLIVCILAIILRKNYNEEFSEYWDYMFLLTMPLGICIGKILILSGVI